MGSLHKGHESLVQQSKKENKKRRTQLIYDKRHQLYELYLELIKLCNPKAFIYENVPGLLTAKSKKKSKKDDVSDDFGIVIVDDDLTIVPTLQEAYDYIEMDEMARQLEL